MPKSHAAALLAEARRLLGAATGRGAAGSPLSPGELEAAARDLLVLQRGLTGERALIGRGYLDERRRLASYLQFYWPVTYAQVVGLLDMACPADAEAPAGDAGGRRRILDLGAGPIPGAIAAADWLRFRRAFRNAADTAATPAVDIVACDYSQLALESAARLAAATGYGFSAKPGWNAEAEAIPDGPFDLIVVGHLVNEIFVGESDRAEKRAGFLARALAALAPDGLAVVLEPALLGVGRELLAARDRLAAAGWTVRAPCRRQGPCPALALDGQTCHSDFAWNPPDIVRDLARRTGLDKGLVKTTGFVFARPSAGGLPGDAAASAAAGAAAGEPASVDGAYRVVSDPMLNKAGRVRYFFCGRPGRLTVSAKPGEGLPAEAAFLALRRSQAVRLEGAVERPGGGWSLGPGTRLTVDGGGEGG